MNEVLKRKDRLFDFCDAAMITSKHNLEYFSGFDGGEGILILTKSDAALIVDSRYTTAAKEKCVGIEVIEYNSKNKFSLIESALDGNTVVGFEDTEMSVSDFDVYNKKLPFNFVGLKNEIDKIRMVKTDEEIKLIKQAEKIGDMVFSEILTYIKAGVSETDIAAEIEYRMRKYGASGVSFDTIVVSGMKTAMPHGIPSDKKLKTGDFVTMDFGCVYKGYCSDMTRTVAVGTVSEKQKEIYNIVLKAQQEGLNSIKAGILGKDADLSARRIIDNAGYGKHFGHSLGHGVGMLIHELPNLSPGSELELPENAIVSCEPGIYIENEFGVRIEDVVVVKNGGIENLTESTKELIIC